MSETQTIEYEFSVSAPDEDGVREVTVDRDGDEMTPVVHLNDNSSLEVTLSITAEYRDGGTVVFVEDDVST